MLNVERSKRTKMNLIENKVIFLSVCQRKRFSSRMQWAWKINTSAIVKNFTSFNSTNADKYRSSGESLCLFFSLFFFCFFLPHLSRSWFSWIFFALSICCCCSFKWRSPLFVQFRIVPFYVEFVPLPFRNPFSATYKCNTMQNSLILLICLGYVCQFRVFIF